ncbi:MAG: hypothetical protein GF388_04360 [Candidatus Aegiribacteria sp.]|nr:hypothetical protein [Candidatus Aegiribacteria sp.]
MRAVLISLLLFSTTCLLAGDQIIMSLEGAEGSVTMPGHEGWLALESVTHDIRGLPADLAGLLEHSPAETSGRLEGEALEGNSVLVLIKELDASTAKLGCESGRFPDNLDIALLTPNGTVFLSLNFEMIELLDMVDTGEGLELSFTAGALNWTFTEP